MKNRFRLLGAIALLTVLLASPAAALDSQEVDFGSPFAWVASMVEEIFGDEWITSRAASETSEIDDDAEPVEDPPTEDELGGAILPTG